MRNTYYDCYNEMIPVTSFMESPLLLKEDTAFDEDTTI